MLSLSRIAAVLANATLMAAPINAQGAWGGKTNGAGHSADVNGIKLYYEIPGAADLVVELDAIHVCGVTGTIRLAAPRALGVDGSCHERRVREHRSDPRKGEHSRISSRSEEHTS